MKRIMLVALAPVLFGGAGASLLDARYPFFPARIPPSAAQIERLIRELDVDEFQTRERATRALLDLNAHALAPLKEVVASKQRLEQVLRAKKILSQLRIYEPGGDVVNGLKLQLHADKGTLRPGEFLTLTTVLCNMTERDLNVMVGYSPIGIYFAFGSSTRRWTDKEEELKWTGGFCGTGAYPLFVAIPAKNAIEYETFVKRGQIAKKPALVLGRLSYGREVGPGDDDYGMIHFPLPVPGKQTLRMVHSASPESNRDRGFDGGERGRPTNPTAPFWAGDIRSNDVHINFAP